MIAIDAIFAARRIGMVNHPDAPGKTQPVTHVSERLSPLSPVQTSIKGEGGGAALV
jgi:hypothetical protein